MRPPLSWAKGQRGVRLAIPNEDFHTKLDPENIESLKSKENSRENSLTK